MKIVAILVLSLLIASSLAAVKKRVLIPVADDMEEVEFISLYDALNRAGATIVVASANPNALQNLKVTGTNKHVFLANTALTSQVLNAEWDIIALPGGLGCATTLGKHAGLIDKLRSFKKSGKVIAAVCASSPLVLGANGLLDDVDATGVPDDGLRKLIPNKARINERVVVSKNIITSQGPGTSLHWAIAVIKQVYGKEKSDRVAALLLVKTP